MKTPAPKTDIDFLSCGIGRGHPFYLLNIKLELSRLRPELEIGDQTAFAVSRGISHKLWRLAKFMYVHGSQTGPVSWLYSHLRQDRKAGDRGLAMRVLGKEIIAWASRSDAPLVVDHPLLADICHALEGRRPLIYMHGELVASPESLTTTPDLTLVPSSDVRNSFTNAGVTASRVAVTGFCVERCWRVTGEAAYIGRISRFRNAEPLTVAFFSSGAEPIEHVRRIVSAAGAIGNAGHRCLIFARRNGMLSRTVDAKLKGRVQLYLHHSIQEEEHNLTPYCQQIDFFVAPAHERTHWALGLGLPIFTLHPNYGAFAKLNAQLLNARGVAQGLLTLSDAARIDETVRSMRETGALERMCAMGKRESGEWGGFETGAREIARRFL